MGARHRRPRPGRHVYDDPSSACAEPLFLQDHIAVGKVVPETVAEIVKGTPTAASTLAARCSAGGDRPNTPAPCTRRTYDLSATGRRRRGGRRDPLTPPGTARVTWVIAMGCPAALQTDTAGPSAAADWGHMDLHGHVERNSGRTSARNCSNRPASTPAIALR